MNTFIDEEHELDRIVEIRELPTFALQSVLFMIAHICGAEEN